MTKMADRELLLQAFELMEVAIKAGDWKVDGACDPDMLFNSIRTRLAHEPEPVAYWRHSSSVKEGWNEFSEARAFDDDTPLYAAPQNKEWVGLTDKEMFDCLVQADYAAVRLPLGLKLFAEFIEAKLKEKNHG
jgi:hypothetical protein